MRDCDRRDGSRQTARWRKRVWLGATVTVFLAVAAWLLWIAGVGWDRRSADAHLAEIEVARAIPDSENAAAIYNGLLQDPKAMSLSDAQSQTGEPLVSGQPVLYAPWLSKDQPEVDAWIKEHQYIIEKLLAAAQLEKCRFPTIIDVADTRTMDRVRSMRQWGFLLRSAANNDIAEGRDDAAIMKWRCLLQMADHLRQQPDLIDHLLANGMEESAMEPMAAFIVTGSPTPTHLQSIEAMPLPTKDRWAEYDNQTRLTDALISQRVKEQMSPLDYLRHPIQTLQTFRVARAINSLLPDKASLFDNAGYLYRRSIAASRGIRILVALRRHKNATNRWPLSLHELKASLPEEILTDPLNGGSFAYKPTDDALSLYSKGRNSIDENGQHDSNGPDDWCIWPPRERHFGTGERQER